MGAVCSLRRPKMPLRERDRGETGERLSTDTINCTTLRPKGWIGHVLTIGLRTAYQNQASLSPCGQREISVHSELTLGHLRYH